MKAEQRKELETNTLADRMGRIMQRAQGGSRRAVVTYLIVVAALIAGGWFTYNYFREAKVETSKEWLYFYDGANDLINPLASKLDHDHPVGTAARFQIAYHLYWDEGIKRIGIDPNGALQSIKQADTIYAKLAEECKDDASPVFWLQATLMRGVANESLAVQDRTSLKRAKDHYNDIIAKYEGEKYAEVRYAKERLDAMKDERTLSNTYEDIQKKVLKLDP
ncbi:MAG: hypothetical protein HY289_08770, partial [Planctomycetes bacterium]|nr:hypothetical protein [Planctomycetota bacterium]